MSRFKVFIMIFAMAAVGVIVSPKTRQLLADRGPTYSSDGAGHHAMKCPMNARYSDGDGCEADYALDEGAFNREPNAEGIIPIEDDRY